MNDDTLKKSGTHQKPVPKPDLENKAAAKGQMGETRGPKGPEPTRYGDWEKKGRCIDF